MREIQLVAIPSKGRKHVLEIRNDGVLAVCRYQGHTLCGTATFLGATEGFSVQRWTASGCWVVHYEIGSKIPRDERIFRSIVKTERIFKTTFSFGFNSNMYQVRRVGWVKERYAVTRKRERRQSSVDFLGIGWEKGGLVHFGEDAENEGEESPSRVDQFLSSIRDFRWAVPNSQSFGTETSAESYIEAAQAIEIRETRYPQSNEEENADDIGEVLCLSWRHPQYLLSFDKSTPIEVFTVALWFIHGFRNSRHFRSGREAGLVFRSRGARLTRRVLRGCL